MTTIAGAFILDVVIPATPTEDDLIAALEDRGCRITQPRRDLAASLTRRRDAFSAEDVAAELDGVGRATVYRTLRLLVDAGALCKTTMPDGSPRYSLDNARHHHHLVCVDCGRIDEFRHPAVERMLRAMSADVEGELVGHRLELYRRCGACSADEEGAKRDSILRGQGERSGRSPPLAR